MTSFGAWRTAGFGRGACGHPPGSRSWCRTKPPPVPWRDVVRFAVTLPAPLAVAVAVAGGIEPGAGPGRRRLRHHGRPRRDPRAAAGPLRDQLRRTVAATAFGVLARSPTTPGSPGGNRSTRWRASIRCWARWRRLPPPRHGTTGSSSCPITGRARGPPSASSPATLWRTRCGSTWAPRSRDADRHRRRRAVGTAERDAHGGAVRVEAHRPPGPAVGGRRGRGGRPGRSRAAMRASTRSAACDSKRLRRYVDRLQALQGSGAHARSAADEARRGQARGRASRQSGQGYDRQGQRQDRASLEFRLDRARLRQVRRREGRYLLRTNLTRARPAQLWTFYIQLTEVEQAFKELKHDLAVRPIYHSSEKRIEAHIFVAFLAYCLQVTLKANLKRLAHGITPARSSPSSRPCRWWTCVSHHRRPRTRAARDTRSPSPITAMLLDRCSWLPEQPPPKITPAQARQQAPAATPCSEDLRPRCRIKSST